jgi:hypothetical protein
LLGIKRVVVVIFAEPFKWRLNVFVFPSHFACQSKSRAFWTASLSGLAEPVGVIAVGMLFRKPTLCNFVHLMETSFASCITLFCPCYLMLLFSTDVTLVTAAFLFPSSLDPEILEGLLGSG